jgi:hypothetical protein
MMRYVAVLSSLLLCALALAQPPTPVVQFEPVQTTAVAGEIVTYTSTITNPEAPVVIPIAINWDYVMPDGSAGSVVKAGTITVQNAMTVNPTAAVSPGAAYIMGSSKVDGAAVPVSHDVNPATGMVTIAGPTLSVLAGASKVFEFSVLVGNGGVVDPGGAAFLAPPAPPSFGGG